MSPDCQPHVVPLNFRYNPDEDTIDDGGFGIACSKKWRDVGRNPRAAFVVDDIAAVDPWRVRGIEIRGTVEPLASGCETLMPGFAGKWFASTPAASSVGASRAPTGSPKTPAPSGSRDGDERDVLGAGVETVGTDAGRAFDFDPPFPATI